MPKPKSTTVLTVSVPRKMAERVEAAMKVEQRTRSELVREALRTYFARPDEEARLLARIARLPIEKPTHRELRIIKQGRQEMRRGNYWTLDAFRDWLIADEHPQARTKASSARTAKRARKTPRHA